jgi:large subunit ribosomal protein L21
MYAIIAESGKQYKVTSGDVIRIDRAKDATPGLVDAKTITFDQVLLVGGEGAPRIGTPTVASATVTGEIVRAFKGPKIDIIKYKRRKGFHKHIGHRQNLIEVRITAINA